MRVKPYYLLAGLLSLSTCLFLNSSKAYAHGGIEPGDNLLLAWSNNPFPSLILLMVAYIYVNGLRRWNNPSHPINIWQKTCFFSGLACVFIALQSPIDPLAEHQFSIHQVQHLLLRMLGPLLILLGAPLTPILRGMPRWALMNIVRPTVGNGIIRILYFKITNPVLTSVIFMGSLYMWQVPFLHNLAVRNDVFHEFMHFSMLFSGLLFWWIVIDPKPHRSRLHYGLRVLFLGLLVLPNTLLGAIITFSRSLLYESYYEFPQPFALAPMLDQQIGGLSLWVVGDMMCILVAGITMIFWYNNEKSLDQVP